MSSVSHIAAQTLQRQIISSYYPAGSALPPQRQLSARLGISRASLREAISMLEALGLLRSHPGKGVFVATGTRPSPNDLPAGPSAMMPAPIYQLRYVIEPANASLAAQGRSPDGRIADPLPLRASLAAMQAALSTGDLLTAADEDLRFHLSIAALCGNPGLLAIAEQFKGQLAFSLRLPFADRPHVWQTVDEHQSILDAIAVGDAAAARAAMQKHLLSAARRVGLSFVLP